MVPSILMLRSCRISPNLWICDSLSGLPGIHESNRKSLADWIAARFAGPAGARRHLYSIDQRLLRPSGSHLPVQRGRRIPTRKSYQIGLKQRMARSYLNCISEEGI